MEAIFQIVENASILAMEPKDLIYLQIKAYTLRITRACLPISDKLVYKDIKVIFQIAEKASILAKEPKGLAYRFPMH